MAKREILTYRSENPGRPILIIFLHSWWSGWPSSKSVESIVDVCEAHVTSWLSIHNIHVMSNCMRRMVHDERDANWRASQFNNRSFIHEIRPSDGSLCAWILLSVCKNGRVTRNEERERELTKRRKRKEQTSRDDVSRTICCRFVIFYFQFFLFISTFLSFSRSLANERERAHSLSFSFFLTSSLCPDSSSKKKESSFLLLNDSRRLLMLMMIHPFFLRCISLMSLKCVFRFFFSFSHLPHFPSIFTHQLFTEDFISSSSSAHYDW